MKFNPPVFYQQHSTQCTCSGCLGPCCWSPRGSRSVAQSLPEGLWYQALHLAQRRPTASPQPHSAPRGSGRPEQIKYLIVKIHDVSKLKSANHGGHPHPSSLQLQTEELTLVEVGGGLVDYGQLSLGVHQLLGCFRRIAKADGCVDCCHGLRLCSWNGTSFIFWFFGIAQLATIITL